MVEYIVAIDVTRAQGPADALYDDVTTSCWCAMTAGSFVLMTTWWCCFKHFPFASSSYQNMTCANWESTEGRKQVSGTQESFGFTPRCSLVPGHRFCQKGRMLCSSPACQSLSPELNVEHVFLILLTKEGVHCWSFMGFVEKAIPLLCYVDWLEEATVPCAAFGTCHWNMMEPWSQP